MCVPRNLQVRDWAARAYDSEHMTSHTLATKLVHNLCNSLPAMEATIKALQVAGIRDQVAVVVGGAPVTEVFAKQIGSDGFAPDASRAAKLAISFKK